MLKEQVVIWKAFPMEVNDPSVFQESVILNMYCSEWLLYIDDILSSVNNDILKILNSLKNLGMNCYLANTSSAESLK